MRAMRSIETQAAAGGVARASARNVASAAPAQPAACARHMIRRVAPQERRGLRRNGRRSQVVSQK
jgi:hypothetical protein